MKKLRMFILIFTLTLIAVSRGGSMFAAAPIFDESCDGATAGSPVCSGTVGGNPISGSDGVITSVVNILSFVIGVASVIMVIFGGFKYITSNGDSGSIENAKNTILYAIIGVLVAVLAQAIVIFVLRRL